MGFTPGYRGPGARRRRRKFAASYVDPLAITLDDDDPSIFIRSPFRAYPLTQLLFEYDDDLALPFGLEESDQFSASVTLVYQRTTVLASDASSDHSFVVEAHEDVRPDTIFRVYPFSRQLYASDDELGFPVVDAVDDVRPDAIFRAYPLTQLLFEGDEDLAVQWYLDEISPPSNVTALPVSRTLYASDDELGFAVLASDDSPLLETLFKPYPLTQLLFEGDEDLAIPFGLGEDSWQRPTYIPFAASRPVSFVDESQELSGTPAFSTAIDDEFGPHVWSDFRAYPLTVQLYEDDEDVSSPSSGIDIDALPVPQPIPTNRIRPFTVMVLWEGDEELANLLEIEYWTYLVTNLRPPFPQPLQIDDELSLPFFLENEYYQVPGTGRDTTPLPTSRCVSSDEGDNFGDLVAVAPSTIVWHHVPRVMRDGR